MLDPRHSNGKADRHHQRDFEDAFRRETGYPDELPAPLRSLKLAHLLDSKYEIAGIRFGLDALIGLVPVVGDTVTFALGALIVWDAVRLGARAAVVARMLLNLTIDWLIGLVPGVDLILDVLFKANRKNAELLEREWRAGRLSKASPWRETSQRGSPAFA